MFNINLIVPVLKYSLLSTKHRYILNTHIVLFHEDSTNLLKLNNVELLKPPFCI